MGMSIIQGYSNDVMKLVDGAVGKAHENEGSIGNAGSKDETAVNTGSANAFDPNTLASGLDNIGQFELYPQGGTLLEQAMQAGASFSVMV